MRMTARRIADQVNLANFEVVKGLRTPISTLRVPLCWQADELRQVYLEEALASAEVSYWHLPGVVTRQSFRPVSARKRTRRARNSICAVTPARRARTHSSMT